MNRHRFLRDFSRGALSLWLAPLAGCRTPRRGSSLAELSAPSDFAGLAQQIPKWMEDARLPGLSIAVVGRGQSIWTQGFGVRDAASRKPVTTETIFTCCSMTKPVFAYFVMNLCEKGVLGLDAPLIKYAPTRYLEGDSRLDLITARHCLTHTTGFQNWREEDGKPLSIHFAPGARWSYSGEGYAYLASVITHLLKQPLEEYMQANLLTPFGMRSSAYVWTPRIAKRMAWPHDGAGRRLDRNKKPTRESVARYGAAGDLLTTPADYAKFLVEVIDPKPPDNFRLDAKSRDEMVRPQAPVLNSSAPTSWGIGWAIVQDGEHSFLYHSGDDEGWHSLGVASLANKSALVVMTNGEGGKEVLEKLLMSDAMQRFLKAAPQPQTAPGSAGEERRTKKAPPVL